MILSNLFEVLRSSISYDRQCNGQRKKDKKDKTMVHTTLTKQKIKLNCTNPFKYGVSSDTLDGKAVPAPLEIPHRFTHVKCLEMSNVRGNKDDNGQNGTYLWESVTQFSSDDHLNTFEVMI